MSLLIKTIKVANPFFLKDLYNDFQNLYLHPSGRLAQLVQSTSFTPRGSGVRTPHLPLKIRPTHSSGFILFNKVPLLIIVG